MLSDVEIILTLAAWSIPALGICLSLANRLPHRRDDDRDHHAEWLGIGGAVNFHGSAE